MPLAPNSVAVQLTVDLVGIPERNIPASINDTQVCSITVAVVSSKNSNFASGLLPPQSETFAWETPAHSIGNEVVGLSAVASCSTEGSEGDCLLIFPGNGGGSVGGEKASNRKNRRA